MVQGGAGNTENSEKFTRGVVNLAQNDEGLQQEAKEFVQSKKIEVTDLKDPEKAAELLNTTEGQKLLKSIIDHPEFTNLIKQAGKDPITIQKADSLGKRLAIGAGIGAGIVGSGILGGVIGANLAAVGAGLAVAAPFIGIGLGVLTVIALIGLAIYKREAISKGIGNATKYAGEKVTHLLKNLIDKLPFRSSNAVNHLAKLEHDYVQAGYDKPTGNLLPDDAVFIKKYFLNEDGFKALEDLITEKNANAEKFTVKDGENKDVELTLNDLKVLKEKGDSTHTKADGNKFKAKLDKFKLIINEANKDIRTQVDTRVKARAEAKQDEIHERQKLQTPLPSSALCRNSIANTEFLKVVDENINGLLEKVAELKNTGKNQGFRQDFHKFAQEYNLDTLILEKRGGPTEAESKNLAEQFKNLTPKQIGELNAKVDELKKNQDRGPETQNEGVKLTSVKTIEGLGRPG